MPRILVTPRSVTSEGHPALERLARAGFEVVMPPAGKMPTAADLKQLVPGCVGWLAGVEPITDDVLSAASDLRVISRNGTGVDAIDLDSARRRGIEIRRADGANARGVAELAIGMILDTYNWDMVFTSLAIGCVICFLVVLTIVEPVDDPVAKPER